MTLTVTQQDFCAATGCSAGTAISRFRDLPHDGARPQRYPLAAVLPRFKQNEINAGAVERLFNLAEVEGDGMVIDTPLSVGRGLLDSLTTEQHRRFADVRVDFVAALYERTESSEIWQYLPVLELKLLLVPGVLWWVILADRLDMPDFHHFALPFALANAEQEAA